MSVEGTFTADGESLHLAPNSPDRDASGVHVHLSGDFGEGTATVYFKTKNSGWKAVTNGAFTTAIDKKVSVANAVAVKIVLTDSTAPELFYYISNMSLA